MIPRAVVTVDGVDISCDVELGVTITHGRSSSTEQPDPATASFRIVAFDRATVDRLTINAVIAVDARFADDTVLRRFVGTITDIAVSWETVDLANVEVTAASPVALLGRTFIGDDPWPTEDDGARAERILAVVQSIPYSTDFTSDLDGWGAIGATAVWENGTMKITWAPTGTQVVQRVVSGLLPGGRYLYSAVARPGTGGLFLAVPPPDINGFGEVYAPPDLGWKTLTSVFTADVSGNMLLQFWPTGPGTCYIDKVTLTAAHQIPIGQIDPGTVQVLARDVDRQPCLGLLQELADDAGGMAWHTRGGAICYADNEHRRNTPTSITLDCGQILMSPQWMHTTEGLTNEITIGYGATPEGGEQPTYHIYNADSIAAYGRLAATRSTQLAALADATARAEVALARSAWPVWNMPQIPVDLALASIDEAATRTLLGLEIHALISVTGLPSQGPASTATLWVEGWAERISAIGDTGTGSWEIVLAVTDYCRTSAFVRWDDVPETVTWDNVDPSLTWDQMYCLGPPVPGGDRWNDVPANTRWDNVPASVTWDSWNQYVGA